MRLFLQYLRKEAAECVENGIRISVIGRRDRLPNTLCRAIDAAEQSTARGSNLHLRIAVDYSSRDSILHAARSWNGRGAPTREDFAHLLSDGVADVDLLIRTGGEQRLSDFSAFGNARTPSCTSLAGCGRFQEDADLEGASAISASAKAASARVPVPAAAALVRQRPLTAPAWAPCLRRADNLPRFVPSTE